MSDSSPHPIRFDDVAELYDAYVTVDFDIPFWLQEARAARGPVLELTSGTGRVSLPLLRAGIDLTCVDYSAPMLAVLRRKLTAAGLKCAAVCQDVADMSLPLRFGMVFIPFHSFSEIIDPVRQQFALLRIYTHLVNGGTFLCSLQNPAVRGATLDGTTRDVGSFPLPDGGTIQVTAAMRLDAATGLVTGHQFFSLTTAEGEQREIDLPVQFVLLKPEQFRALAEEVGFKVVEVYGNYERGPFLPAESPFMIWRLQRPRP